MLQPGTLNVRVPNLNEVVDSLGEPAALTEHDTPIGPLRWWPVRVAMPDGMVLLALLVRGARTKTDYLEITSPVHFRALGLRDGHTVSVEEW